MGTITASGRSWRNVLYGTADVDTFPYQAGERYAEKQRSLIWNFDLGDRIRLMEFDSGFGDLRIHVRDTDGFAETSVEKGIAMDFGDGSRIVIGDNRLVGRNAPLFAICSRL